VRSLVAELGDALERDGELESALSIFASVTVWTFDFAAEVRFVSHRVAVRADGALFGESVLSANVARLTHSGELEVLEGERYSLDSRR
jgi:hypothetical protein